MTFAVSFKSLSSLTKQLGILKVYYPFKKEWNVLFRSEKACLSL